MAVVSLPAGFCGLRDEARGEPLDLLAERLGVEGLRVQAPVVDVIARLGDLPKRVGQGFAALASRGEVALGRDPRVVVARGARLARDGASASDRVEAHEALAHRRDLLGVPLQLTAEPGQRRERAHPFGRLDPIGLQRREPRPQPRERVAQHREPRLQRPRVVSS